MSADELVVLRCATIVIRNGEILVVHRSSRGDWVLPGGRPKPQEGALACARREVGEETGLDIDPGRCAFVLDTSSTAPYLGNLWRAADEVLDR